MQRGYSRMLEYNVQCVIYIMLGMWAVQLVIIFPLFSGVIEYEKLLLLHFNVCTS